MCFDMFDFYILYPAKIKEDVARSMKIHKCRYDIVKFYKQTRSGHLESVLKLLPLSSFRESEKSHKNEKDVL